MRKGESRGRIKQVIRRLLSVSSERVGDLALPAALDADGQAATFVVARDAGAAAAGTT